MNRKVIIASDNSCDLSREKTSFSRWYVEEKISF